jgi:hypothetical protein
MFKSLHGRELRVLTLMFVTWGAIAAASFTVNYFTFQRMALRTAYSRERIAREHIHIVKVEKPSTVTFSTGEVVDVGRTPGHVAGAAGFIAAVGGILLTLAPLFQCYPDIFGKFNSRSGNRIV